MIADLIFLTSMILLILCTLAEIILGRGFGGFMMRQSFPWLIAGWCLWLGLFYAYRKINKKYEDEYNDEYF